MLLKRHYEPDALAAWLSARDAEIEPKVADVVKATGMTEAQATKLLRNQYSDANALPKVAHIEVKQCGAKQNINQRFIDRGIAEGWMILGEGKVRVKTASDHADLIFTIERVPGHYSCYTGEKLNGQDEAKAHVQQQNGESPDEAHPAGYEKIAYYECSRDAETVMEEVSGG